MMRWAGLVARMGGEEKPIEFIGKKGRGKETTNKNKK
jgi:hypothetical protein